MQDGAERAAAGGAVDIEIEGEAVGQAPRCARRIRPEPPSPASP